MGYYYMCIQVSVIAHPAFLVFELSALTWQHVLIYNTSMECFSLLSLEDTPTDLMDVFWALAFINYKTDLLFDWIKIDLVLETKSPSIAKKYLFYLPYIFVMS